MRKLLPLAVLLLSGCAPTAPSPAGHATAPTIVSLNPCTDAILAEVADARQLLAISHYSHDPRASSLPVDRAQRWPATGGTVEEVLALDPDVVVAGTFLPPATQAAFRRLGIRVEMVGIASTVDDSRQQVRDLARLAGQAARGEDLVHRIDAAMARSRHDGAKLPTLLWQQGGIVAGPDSLIARLMDHAGFSSHSAARGLGQGAYVPLERVLADPPALVLTAGSEHMLRHPVLRQVPNMRHQTLDPAMLYCGGPTIIRALDRLVQVRAAMPVAATHRDSGKGAS